ncbi:MAG: hypothetical protein IT521_05260 [Burkholderiales bacterium]|nr:hypothetical protein [Burkholderiales bacterium]
MREDLLDFGPFQDGGDHLQLTAEIQATLQFALVAERPRRVIRGKIHVSKPGQTASQRSLPSFVMHFLPFHPNAVAK